MGRPKGSGKKKITDEQIDQMRKLAGVGNTLDQIASIMDISTSWLDVLIKQDPRIKSAIHNGRASALNNVKKTAYQMAISGDHPAMTMFYLKTQDGWRETNRLEHTGAEGVPLVTERIVVDETELKKAIEKIRSDV